MLFSIYAILSLHGAFRNVTPCIDEKALYLVDYPLYYMSTVTGWGYAWCLHTVLGEGRAHKEILNPLPVPKFRSAMFRYCVVLGLLLCLYIHVFNVLWLNCYLIHDLIVNFLIPLYVDMYLVFRLSITNFGVT